MKKVAIIGTGVAGIAALRVFSEYKNFEFELTAFERNESSGGIWKYTRNDWDKFVSPMYRDLKSNLPKEVMYYPDMFYDCAIKDSFITHEVVLDYIKSYIIKYGLDQYIKFKTIVKLVEPISSENGSTSWKLTIQDLNTSIETIEFYDVVIICTGNFENPRIPDIEGLNNFKGDIIHSKYYKIPEKFRGKSVCVLGARSSGMDISLQLCDYADKVYLCHNRPRINWKNSPKNLIEMHGINKVTDDGKIMIYGPPGYEELCEIIDVNDIIFCTGYDMNVDYLSSDCKLKYDDRYLGPLFQHVVNVYYPDSMFVVGLGFEIVPFVHFYLQSKLALACVTHQLHGTEISTSHMLEIVEKNEAECVKLNKPKSRYQLLGTEHEFIYLSELEDLSKSVMTVNIPKHLEMMFSLTKKWRLERTSQYRIVRLKLNHLNKLGFEMELPDDCDDEMKKEFEHDYEELLKNGLSNKYYDF